MDCLGKLDGLKRGCGVNADSDISSLDTFDHETNGQGSIIYYVVA